MGMPKQREEPTNRRVEIAEALRTRIAAGEFVPGALIPSSRDIARTYACAPMTAQAALRILADEGTITTRARQGSIVTLVNQSVAGPVERMHRSALGGLLRAGEQAEILAARVAIGENPDAAAAFGLGENDALGMREYVLRDAAGTVTTYGRSFIRPDVWDTVPELREPVPIVDGIIGAVRRVLGIETVGVPTPRKAEAATAEEAEVLGVAPGSPVLVEVTACQTLDGTVVEYAVYIHPRGYWVGR